MTESAVHEKYMARAIELAKKAWGETHPNPLAGAVLVEDGEIVAEGYHSRAGAEHAEKAAFNNLGRAPTDRTVLYMTMEPSSTVGRTPAGTDMLLSSGLKKIVIGSIDPNPHHAGRAIDILLEGGLDVTSGVLSDECDDMNLIFNHWITHETPFLAGKMATTLDGRIATRTGESKWISSEASRENVMRWRRYFPAIAVGSETILRDNPRLSSRSTGKAEWCPLRFVFDRSLRTVDEAPEVYTDRYKERTIVVTSKDADEGSLRRLDDMGVSAWGIYEGDDAVFWKRFRESCRRSGIDGVYFEGGSTLLSNLLAFGHLNYLFSYRAPLIFGDESSFPSFRGLTMKSIKGAPRLEKVKHADFGDDHLMRGFVNYSAR